MPHGAIPFPFGQCKICNDKATGLHYGVNTCEGCKGFFKRSLPKAEKYKCFFGGFCEITPQNRNRCKACRFHRCLANGMALEAVKMGRIPKVEKERALSKARQENEEFSHFDSGSDYSPDWQDGQENGVYSAHMKTIKAENGHFYSQGNGHCQTKTYEEQKMKSYPKNLESMQDNIFSHIPYSPKSFQGLAQLPINMTSPTKLQAYYNEANLQWNTNSFTIKQEVHSPVSPTASLYNGSQLYKPLDSEDSNSFSDRRHVGSPLESVFPIRENRNEKLGQMIKGGLCEDMVDRSASCPADDNDFGQTMMNMHAVDMYRPSSCDYNNIGRSAAIGAVTGLTQNIVLNGETDGTNLNGEVSEDDYDSCLPLEARDANGQLKRVQYEEELLDYTLERLQMAADMLWDELTPLLADIEKLIQKLLPPHELNTLSKANYSQAKSIWMSLFESIPTVNKQIFSLAQNIPGFGSLNTHDKAAQLEQNYMILWAIISGHFVIGSEIYLPLTNGARYTRWWMCHFLPPEFVEQLVKNATDMKAIGLSPVEFIIVCSILLTESDHTTPLTNKCELDELHDFFCELMKYCLKKTGSNYPANMFKVFDLMQNVKCFCRRQNEWVSSFSMDNLPDYSCKFLLPSEQPSVEEVEFFAKNGVDVHHFDISKSINVEGVWNGRL